MQNEICGRKCIIFNILKLRYHLRNNFFKVENIRLLADMIWALHVRLKNRSLVCGIKEVDSAGCRTCEVFEVFSLLQVSSSLRCFGMDHFEHFERRSMDRLERQTEDVKVFKNFSLETAIKEITIPVTTATRSIRIRHLLGGLRERNGYTRGIQALKEFG